MDKLDLLKKYVEVQAKDETCWYVADNICESYLQQELRKMAWLIEEATPAQIEFEIMDKKAQYDC